MSQNTEPAGIKRRTFLKVLGASGAAAATVGCSPEPTGKLIPYLVQPENTIPGVSTYYATTCRECAAACGVIAETRDGRAIKLEGNPAHPLNRGALCARGQAALQGLYNPDRFRGPMRKVNNVWQSITWDQALDLVAQRLGAAANGLFLNQHESGSFPSFLDAWLQGVGMTHLSVDFEADEAAGAAHRAAYGVAWPRFAFQDARLIVSFGADFLDSWGPSVPQQLDFADARAKLQDAPRVIYVGPRRSLTGLNADQWIACRPGGELEIINFLRGLGTAEQAAQASDVPAATLTRLQQEIAAARPALVVAGAKNARSFEIATAAAQLNQQSGGGPLARTVEGAQGLEGIARFADLQAAIERMRANQVPVVFVRGTNPAYYLPPSMRFAEAFAAVDFKVSFSSYPDETTELCDLVLPDLHPLESWGDAEPVRGVLALQQPVMDPVFSGTRATADVLIQIARKLPAVAGRYPQPTYREWIMSRFPGGPQAIGAALAKGFVPGTVAARGTGTVPAPAAPTTNAAAFGTGDFFLVTYPSPVLGDGRGANKPWLQELPDPVTKVVWSSWVEIHPEKAAQLDIERGDILEVRGPGGVFRAPALPYLGVRPDTVAIALGQGHRSASDQPMFEFEDDGQQWGYGRYARGVGDNAMRAVVAAQDGAGGFVWSGFKATVTKTGDHETIPSTEGSARQHGRGIAQAMTVAALTQPEAAGAHGGHDIAGAASHEFRPGLRSPVAADAQGELGATVTADKGNEKGMYAPDHWSGMAKRRWAMTIDLARCTGCSACVTACYAENNIPTVGAAWQNATVFAVSKPGFNVTRGREMNWLRLERYYEGAEDGHFTPDFETRFVPMLCQHCGNAPCEPVCPVYATYHAPDGLNVQVYNRCVGTRYCSNNCPYKVRYFNWFGYGEEDRKQYAFPTPLNWQLNPDVTVRGKGVMEKCTFCVQRIREAENRASLDNRTVEPDEFTTACAAACPSRAITFGDAADPNWTVAKLAQDRRAYHVFAELNTYTAVVYLKKVTHTELASATTAAPAAAPSPTTPGATAPAPH
jgi:anaerobic selenocysteine-containing dehydrogenase/Fe-S-cluster-containing dehydrogenase component